MRRLLYLFLLSNLPLYALNLEEAIERAMKNNPSLKEKEQLLKASRAETDIAWSYFKPTVGLSYSYNKFSQANFVGADASSAGDAVLGYNLFNGFSDLFNLKGQKESESAAKFAHEAKKSDLRLQVTQAYINYLRSQQQIRVAQDTIKLLEQQSRDAKNFFEQGLFAKNDYLQVDVELSMAQQSQLSAQRNVKIAFYNLKRLLGGELLHGEEIHVLSREEKELNRSQLKEQMFQNRSELKLLQAQNRALDFNYRASVSNYFPVIDAQAKYQVSGDTFIPKGGANFQVHDQRSLSLFFKWALYAGGAGQAERASLLHQKSASDERLNALLLELDFQLEEAIESYILAKNQILVSRKALEQAKENFRITKNQYDANIANTALMLDAQRFLARAQVNSDETYFALYDAMAKIERIVENELF